MSPVISELAEEHNSKQLETIEKTAWPLFIKSNDGYEKADIKLLVFGKETGGWPAGGKPSPYNSNVSIEEMLSEYDNFFNSKKCYEWENYKGFWAGVKQFMEKLKDKMNKLNKNRFSME
jgi:hypothetical protein